MIIQVKGKITEILPIEKRQTQSGTFPSRQFILIEQDGKFQNTLIFNCWAEKCNLLKELKVNDDVTVDFFIKSALSNNRYYTNLHVISIMPISNTISYIDQEF